jgi:hypothetical protein
MFSRNTCYFFVRPKRHSLEVVIFLGRAVRGPLVRRASPASKTKVANVLKIVHRDEVEAPVTDWLREAYERQDVVAAKQAAAAKRSGKTKPRRARTRAKAKPHNRL